ncbi:PREDICTED: probable 28S ribosomal protein S6, mitochondrial [Dinoponera quadriceps]|uniref:Small ribosomal subunit protein bS6m n=1 Tax=Dinoponera quadriceps TaxID=609295 RepID=A0A6P3XL48_DINQU|nr:PREDICTED: probable 28S ribosomal protein S6, mitochondrial [Dinoponera quadriceps]
MPTYEMPLFLRIMKKPDVVATLKRTSETIFKTGGFIRKMENWGTKDLPYKMSANGQVHRQANRFFICFDAPSNSIDYILDECKRDIDVVKLLIFKQFVPVKKECTFQEEMLPPAYRPSVQKLIEQANKQKKDKNKFQYNSGLDYYPFKK